VQQFLKKIEGIYDQIKVDIVDRIGSYEGLNFTTERQVKHAAQISSIISLLDDNYLLIPSEESSFIEFGSGRGELSFYVHQAAGDHMAETNSSITLIDRSRVKHKFDNHIPNCKKIYIDIKDFSLSDYTDKEVVAYSKHLCGSASDLSIMALLGNNSSSNNVFKGAVIALCCHHKCSYNTFSNQEMLQKYDISPNEFKYMSACAPWYTNGMRVGLSPEDGTLNHYTKLSLGARFDFGYKCKRILDIFRMKLLQAKGYDATLVKYCTPEISLENVCLIVKRKSS
jgi:tRNA:m4X modification enzyme